jgi:hypothetical protein
MHSEQRQALPAQAILTLHKQPATQLRVISGCVWLTESHNPQDYFLQPGDAIHLQSDRTVVEALKDSVIAFMPRSAAPNCRKQGANRDRNRDRNGVAAGLAGRWIGRVPYWLMREE